MALSSKASVMAIKKETTEGSVVEPSAASDFVALQDGFSLEGAFQTLENKELKASIGKAKKIQGREAPTASFAHYLRHSGVEGQAPNYRRLLEALFGLETVNATQKSTIVGSTTSVVKLSGGDGATFSRGQALMIKDGANGYSIRPIHSIATDDLSLGFIVPVAPGTGVQLGKAVTYSPLNEGHPTLSIWEYRAGSGAKELMTGCRVTDGSWDFTAGEFVDGNFSIAGVQYCFNPFVIKSTNCKLDFLDNATTRVASVPLGLYKDPIDLASAIQTAMNSLGSANTFTVTYDSATGKYTIASNGTTLTLKWATGANIANGIGPTIGATAADQSAALTYTMVNAITLSAGITPSYDSEAPLVAKDNELWIGDGDKLVAIQAQKVSLQVSNGRKEVMDVTAKSGVSGSVFTERNVKVQISATLNQYQSDYFKRFRAGDTTRFMYNFGVKSGGNWVPGRCGCVYIPTATITAHKIGDDSGLVTLDLELTGFVDDTGAPEIYLSFV